MPKFNSDAFVKSFMEVVEADSASELPKIAKSLENELQKQSAGTMVTVWSPTPLTTTLMNKILKIMKGKSKKELEIENKTDESLIGGFKLEFGDWVYDASLRKNIENINKLLV